MENDLAADFDLVVVVDAPDDDRVARLTERRGMTPEDARARMAAQATREERLAAADMVLDNSGTPDELIAQVDELWTRLQGLVGAGTYASEPPDGGA